MDGAVCTGCGACVSACRSGAMSLSGTSIAALEASASALVEDARGLGLGVAIVCSKASATVELGGDWLELQVPSLSMVSVGWALQVVAAGVGVTLVGCDDPGCGDRAGDVMGLSATVVGEVAPGQRHLVVAWGGRLPAPRAGRAQMSRPLTMAVGRPSPSESRRRRSERSRCSP